MFVPVGCSECGKLFQVERGELGQPASCPWCQARVLALPVAAKTTSDPEPLPLPEPFGTVDSVSTAEPIRRRSSHSGIRPWIVVLALSAVLALFTFLLLRHRGGGTPSFAMESFVAPDRVCQATLPGTAEAVEAPVFTPLQTGASLFASKTWMTRIVGGLGWVDLDPGRSKLLRAEDVLGNVRDGLGRWLGEPAVDKEGLVKSGTAEGIEVRYGQGETRYTARIIAVLDGPQPRVYLVWIGGPHFKPDGELAEKVLASFRIAPPGK